MNNDVIRLLIFVIFLIVMKWLERHWGWWNEYADNTPLTEEEIEKVWTKAHGTDIR